MKILNVLLSICLGVVAIATTAWFTGGLEKFADIPEERLPEVTSSGPQPKLVVDSYEHDFGQMGVNAVQSHVFIVRNEGPGELVLTRGDASCKCTSFTIGDQEPDDDEPVRVASGDAVEVKLEWHPTEPSPEFRQNGKIHTNDPLSRTLILQVTGSVVTQVFALPGSTWDFGVVTGEEDEVRTSGLVLSALDEFEFVSLKSDSEWLTIESQPAAQSDLDSHGAKCGYTIDLSLADAAPNGPFVANLEYEVSNDPGVTYTTRVTANKTGPMQVIPGFGVRWNPNKGLLDLGEIDSAEGKSFQLYLFIHGEKATLDELEIMEVTAKPSILKATVEPDTRFKGTGKRRFRVSIEVEPGSQTGNWMAPRTGSITIKTNHPRLPELLLGASVAVF